MAKINFERDKCIGCGSCQAVCPQCWKLAEDGKADLICSKEIKEVGCNQEAADSCPVQCIQVEK
jgi:ferredoxin